MNFSKAMFYENYLTSDFHTNTVISSLFAYSSKLMAWKTVIRPIGSCLACLHRVMDASGEFGEHERSVRVARGRAEGNSRFLSACQIPQLHP